MRYGLIVMTYDRDGITAKTLRGVVRFAIRRRAEWFRW